MSTPSLSSELRNLYREESRRLQEDFAINGNGRAVVRQRTALLENLIGSLWQEHIAAHGSTPFTLVGIGGFGRSCLFPHSDVDLLFLHESRSTEEAYKPAVRRFSQELWDLRLKVSPATRTLAECERVNLDNVEFTVALLDCRFLAGNQELFSRLHDNVIPGLARKQAQTLLQKLAEITQQRHARYG